MTQNNRANRLSELATLPGEDRRQRLYDALQSAVEALALFVEYQHEQYANICANTLRKLRSACGEDFDELWQALGAGEPPAWLVGEEPAVNVPPLLLGLATYGKLRQSSGEAGKEIEHLRQVVELGAALLQMDWSTDGLPPGMDAEELRAAVAGDLAAACNELGNALSNAGNHLDALAAYEQAIVLQPDFAMWRRNQAGTLIELGRLDEAEAAIAVARQLEPDSPRLAELETELAEARSRSTPAAE
jgi:tetratricopeptide (TPR) repeat protein